MVKGKFVLLLLAAALLCWQFMPMNADTASSGIVDPCSSSTWFLGAGNRCLFVCPQGDGQVLTDGGNAIGVTVRDATGAPIFGILATDFWMDGCTDLCLCGGSGSSNADAATDSSGYTTISGGMAAGGCELTGIYVICQGVIIGCPPTCLAMQVKSPDLDCDLDVDLVDFSLFGGAYPPNPYWSCCDYDCDGDIDLVDFALFAQHWQHVC